MVLSTLGSLFTGISSNTKKESIEEQAMRLWVDMRSKLSAGVSNKEPSIGLFRTHGPSPGERMVSLGSHLENVESIHMQLPSNHPYNKVKFITLRL